MVGHASIEGECRDVMLRLERLICREMGMHKVLDVDEVLNEGMAYESGEGLTHLYPRSGAGEGYVRCVCDAQTECTIHEDAASEDAQRGATREDAETCGNTETADGYANRDDADTCAKGKSCEVGAERYKRDDSPVKPEHAVMRSGRQRGRHDPGRARGGARVRARCLHYSIPVFRRRCGCLNGRHACFCISASLFLKFPLCLWF